MDYQYCIVLITTPDHETAEKIADHLVRNKLAACVNILQPAFSIFTWEGDINEGTETLLIVKTRVNLLQDRIIPAVEKLHPYDVPEIIALPIIGGNQLYLDWIGEVTTE